MTRTLTIGAAGALLLGVSLRLSPSSQWFYPATLTLAAVWVVGAVWCGRVPIRPNGEVLRTIALGALVGGLLVAVFALGGLVVRPIDLVDDQVQSVLIRTDRSMVVLALVTGVSGIAEESFFRGAAWSVVERHPWWWTTVGYAVVTAASGNVMLIFAAVALGLVVGFERRVTGSVLAPAITHITWSISMLFVLPAIF